MDLRSLDTRKRAHEGVDVPLVIGGETKLGVDGEPILFRMKGAEDAGIKRLLNSKVMKKLDTVEALEAFNKDVVMAACVGWSSNFQLDGAPLPFSREALNELSDIPEVRNALAAEVGKSENFMAKP